MQWLTWLRQQAFPHRYKAPTRLVLQAEAWANEYYPPDDVALAARFITVLIRQVNVTVKQLKPETNFVYDLKMDDLEPVEMFMALEEEFQIEEIPTCDAEKLVTIDLTIKYMKQFIPKNPKQRR